MICFCVSTIIRNKTLKMKNILEISTCSVSFVSWIIKKMVCSGSPLKTKELKFHQQLSRGTRNTWLAQTQPAVTAHHLWQHVLHRKSLLDLLFRHSVAISQWVFRNAGLIENDGFCLEFRVCNTNLNGRGTLSHVEEIQIWGRAHILTLHEAHSKHEDRYIWKVIGQPRSLAASEARWWLLPVSVRSASMCHNHCQRGKSPMCCCVKLNSRKTLLKDENWHFASIKVELQLSIIYVVK